MTQTIIPIEQAQTTLAQLVRRAAQGESILIGDNGRAAAVLCPPPPVRPRPRRRLGILEGKLHVPDDFDAPLPPEILAGFYGDVAGAEKQ